MTKVTVPWHYRPIAELKNYGYACSTHGDAVVADARQRHSSSHAAPDESVGEVGFVALLGR